MDVVTDELWISAVAKMPTMSPMNGFSVAAKKESSRSSPADLNPSLSPFTPSRKMKSRMRTTTTRVKNCRVVASLRGGAADNPLVTGIAVE
jgi:hypothetical protein